MKHFIGLYQIANNILMKKTILLLILYQFSQSCLSQKKFNIVCKDFTFDGKTSNQGRNLRNIFEIAISKSNYPFKLLEREKMDKFFEALQEEKNLVRDLSNEWKRKLQLANVDYLVVGDIAENIAGDNFQLIITFIKITGSDVTEKLPMLVTLSRNQFSDNEKLKNIFDNEIQTFLKYYFITNTGQDNMLTVPEFYKEIKKRDSVISNHENSLKQKTNQLNLLDSTVTKLQKEDVLKNQTISNLSSSVVNLQKQNSTKEQELEKLKNDVNNIRDYSNIARLDLTGVELHAGNGITMSDTELSALMKKILRIEDNKVYVKVSDTVMVYVNEVIEKFPKFPFGYYAKAKILLSKNIKDGLPYVFKTIEILEITTSIQGHNPNHDEALAEFKNILKELGITPRN